MNVIIFRLFLITLLQLSLRQLGRLGFQFPPVEQSNVFSPITTKSINGAFQETCALDKSIRYWWRQFWTFWKFDYLQWKIWKKTHNLVGGKKELKRNQGLLCIIIVRNVKALEKKREMSDSFSWKLTLWQVVYSASWELPITRGSLKKNQG